jgi:hypothetical protein
MRSAEQVRAVDMDADGTDELVVTAPRQDVNPDVLPIAVLKWDGQRFTSQSAQLGALGGGPLIPLGDSDGLPGDEMGLVRETQTSAVLHRIALGPTGRVRVETASLPFGGSLVGIAGPNGGRLVLGDDIRRSVLLRWPGGGRIKTLGGPGAMGVPIAAVGDGANVALVEVRNPQRLDVLGPDFRAIHTGVTPSEADTLFRRGGVATYVGPLPGGMAGSPAYLFHGRLVRAAGGSAAGVIVTNVATMPGMVPIGLFGRQSGLMALASPVSLGVEVGLDATREGGQLSQPAGRLRSTVIVVTNATTALAPEVDDGTLQPDPQGSVRVEARVFVPTLLAGGTFVVPVVGPPGTQLRLEVGDVVTLERINRSGDVNLRVKADDYEDGDRLRATLLAVTPSGQGYGSSWNVVIRTRPPALSDPRRRRRN